MEQTEPAPTPTDDAPAPVLKGIAAGPGGAVAPVARMAAPPSLPEREPEVVDTPAEQAAARDALESVATDLEGRAADLDGEGAAVLNAQALMARDPELRRQVEEGIRDGRAAAWAVRDACGRYQDLLLAAGGYLAERAADLADIRDRTVAVLLGLPMPGLPDPGHEHVLVADDLAPADTVRLDTTRVRAIVTRLGGPTSHTVILARSLGLPAVVGCTGAEELADGVLVAVNGDTGTVEVDPAPEAAEQLRQRAEHRRAVLSASSGPGRTADGVPVSLLLNAGEGDPDEAAAHDSEGIGLLRTEFLFLDRAEPPTIIEQTEAYTRLFRAFAGRTVTVRTLDAGSDKPLAFAATGPEDNPALGVRGFRTARVHPNLLSDQLTAIAAAADATDHKAKVRVMAPMVSTSAEAEEFAALARTAGLGGSTATEVGVMVEVPAAALLADRLLKYVDFVSIGTNDLAQYTMAADRTLGSLPDLLDPWQPALLSLIDRVGSAGAKSSRSVGVCGEAAADPLLALVLVGLGVNSLSTAPPALPAVRYALARHTKADCRGLAELALAADIPERSREVVRGAAHPEVANL
ncbi:phosphoenolpyruvate--protein phosphotransferase [Nocardiopsis ganjiahuensis]|uniref:phosphoenolpyruvate--protein phosphotransferase n=1 Tax=Nocardiopsis ganjiahuensis TaxID=239984 RepID=UPI000346B035|nr:phosphoenolpyruvate--protein phosphotransferase [Nocardiopsis ganjiahuensis]